MPILPISISFKAQPDNYKKIDEYVSRSAQPKADDFKWLKEQGVTDVFNFRTMYKPMINFSEQEIVEELGMHYHNIPTRTDKPEVRNVVKFLDEIDKVKSHKGKAHIHCMAGADRTGLYAYIYKMLNGIGTKKENEKEWLKLGHNQKRFPKLMSWANNFIKFKNFLMS